MRRQALVLAVVSALTFFVGLHRAAISDSDEAFYAEAAREMVESGDWLTPRFNYELRFQKPILYYWLAAAAYRVAGVSEAAARVPSALAGLGLVLVTWCAGRRYATPRGAFIGALVVASNFGYFFIARLALPDLPLALFIVSATAAGLEAARAYGGDMAVRGRGLPWLLLSSVCAALAVLTKGPVGVVLPALVVVPVAAAAWRRGDGAWRLPASHLFAAFGVFVAVAAPWFLVMAGEHGIGFLRQFFVGENLERFASDRYNEPRSVLFYVPVVAGGLLPWSPLLLLGIPRAVRWLRRVQPLSRDEAWLVTWALVPLIFYSLSVGKQPRYVLPVLPPIALLVGSALDRRTTQKGRAPQAVAWGVTASGILLAAIGAFLWRAAPILIHNPPGVVGLAAAASLGAGALVVGLAWLGAARRLPLVVAVGTSATLLAVHFAVYSAGRSEPVRQLARLHALHRQPGTRTGTYRVFVRNLVFYTGVPQTDLETQAHLVAFLQAPERVLCLMTQDDLGRLESATMLRPRRLAAVRYFNPAGVRLRTALSPEPEKDLETVVLVANRD